MKKKIVMIACLMIFLMPFLIPVKAQSEIKEDYFEWLGDCDIRCVGNTCNTILGTTVWARDIDKQCKEITEIERLDLTGKFKIVYESDGVHGIDVVKYNYSCIIIKPKAEDTMKYEYNKDVPIKIDDTVVGTVKIPGILSPLTEIELCPEKGALNHNYSFGEKSTTIILQDAETENLEDGYFDEDGSTTGAEDRTLLDLVDGTGEVPFYKFKRPAEIDDGDIINNAELVLTSTTNSDERYYVYRVANQTWSEETIDDVCPSVACANLYSMFTTLINTSNSDDVGFGKHYINATLGVAADVAAGNANMSFALNVTEVGDTADYAYLCTKEHATTEYRPLLNITYTEVDNDPPTWSNNQTNGTTNGTLIEHAVYWDDNIEVSGCIFSFCNGTYDDGCPPGTSAYCDGTATACSNHENETYCDYDDGCSWTPGGNIELEFETFTTGTDLNPVTNGNWSTSYDGDSGCIWWKDTDGTSSASTGPCSGASNCAGDDAGYDDNNYAYVETSSANCNTGTAHAYLDYDEGIDSDSHHNLHFYFAYNMYGATIGQLNFQVYNDSWNTEWTLTGNQGTDWHLVDVDLSDYADSGTLDIRFDYYRNGQTSYTGDVAVDVLNLTDVGGSGSCTGSAEACGNHNESQTECEGTACTWHPGEGGGWVNDSWTDVTNWFNVSKYVNETVGATVGWQQWCNDTMDNWNWTDEFSYITTEVGAPEDCWHADPGDCWAELGCDIDYDSWMAICTTS